MTNAMPSSGRQQLESVRQSIVSKTPRACGCAHECTVAQHYRVSDIADTTNASIEFTLCPAEVQRSNPCCAHATLSFGPDTFTEEIDALIEMGVIKREEWETRVRQAQLEISEFDVSSALAVVNRRYNLQEYKRKQQPIVDKLCMMKDALLRAIDEKLSA